jgi:hypothetical protein
MNNDSMVSLFILGIYFAGVIGWILNIIQIASGNMTSNMLILRVVGIVLAPLGAVLGWI